MATIFLREGRSEYYARVFVPASLHAIVGRKEVWKCLETDSYEKAKIRAALCASNDFQKVQEIADELLTAHHITLDKDSLDYKRLCHELLKGHQTILRKELDRWEGRFEDIADLGFSAGNGNGATISATASLVPPKPLGEALTLYFGLGCWIS